MPILIGTDTQKTVVHHADQGLWFSKLKEIISKGGNDITKETQCCLMIKHSTCDSHCNMLMSQMKVQFQYENKL